MSQENPSGRRDKTAVFPIGIARPAGGQKMAMTLYYMEE